MATPNDKATYKEPSEGKEPVGQETKGKSQSHTTGSIYKEKQNELTPIQKQPHEIKPHTPVTDDSDDSSDVALCDRCDVNIPAKLCSNCNMHLCNTCAKSHVKVEQFNDHNLMDIVLSVALPKSGEVEEGLGKCHTHGFSLDIYCLQCIAVLCHDCKSYHTGHKLETINDHHLYQKVCNEQIQQLLKEVQDIEDIRMLLEKNIGVYGDVIAQVNKWEHDLLEQIKAKAEALRQKMSQLKAERTQKLTANMNSLVAKSKELDSKIEDLNTIRKSMDIEILSQEIAKSQSLLAKLESHKNGSIPVKNVSKVTDILPKTNKIEEIYKLVDQLFTENVLIEQDPLPYESLQVVEDIPMRTDTSTSGYGYRLCKSREQDKIIIHRMCKNDVYVMNRTTEEMKEHVSDVTIMRMIETKMGEYVAIDNFYGKLHLLNNNFKTQYFQGSSPHYNMYDLRYLSHRRFFLLEVSATAPSMAKISILVVYKNKICTESSITTSVEDVPWYIDLSADMKYIWLCSDRYLYKVNRSTSTCTRHDNSPYVSGRIYSFMVDAADNILVGDSANVLHMFNYKYEHTRLMKTPGKCRDLMVEKRRLYMTFYDKLLGYE